MCFPLTPANLSSPPQHDMQKAPPSTTRPTRPGGEEAGSLKGGSGSRRSSVGAIGERSAGSIHPSTPPSFPKGPRSASLSSLDEGDSSPLVLPPATRSLKVPDVAVPMQHSLLKRISAFQSKEELLEFVSHYHCLLDLINLVTCLYRLAKMSKDASRGRSTYLAELMRHPTFQLLLRSISSKFLQGHLNFLHSHEMGLKVDCRCLSNLCWALAKLDLSADDSALTTEIALTAAPFIVRTLDTSSPQGLANMLWSYAKLPVAPPSVVAALMAKISDQLVAQSVRGDGSSTFDAQALSNSIWALAHLKSRGMEVDALHSPPTLRFLNELARAAGRQLVRPHNSLPPPGRHGGELRLAECQRYLALVEREFSCQALVNIAWSFATLLGPACCSQPAIAQLFGAIHDESLVRLRCTALVLGSGQSLPYVGGGGFNEQALSNAVYAMDKVGLLSAELLGAVFDVSALRLRRGSMAHHPDLSTFKPQELCTLLKACHTGIAAPWVFLGALLRLLSAHPTMADAWTTAERLELHRACQLFSAHQAEAAAAVAAAGRQGGMLGAADFSQAMNTAQGLANSIASSISAAGGCMMGPMGPNSNGAGSVGRLSGLGGSPHSMGMGMMGDGRRMSSGRPRSSSGASGRSTFAPGAAAPAAASVAADAAPSTFGQLPASAALGAAELQLCEQLLFAQQQQNLAGLLQQQQQQQQNLAAALGGGGGGAGGQQKLTCPVCSVPLRQHEALAHVEGCLANRDAAAAAGLEYLLMQQAQAQQDAAVRWAAQQQQQQQQQAANQQQQNLVLARLQQLQQQGLLAVARQQQQQQQQQQSVALMGGLDDGSAALPPWMLDGAAARPPLRPGHRM